MKIPALLLGVVAAGKGGRGGKHGNVNMEGTRFNWKIPKCITSPEFCQEDTVVTARKGQIELKPEDYDNHRNVMVSREDCLNFRVWHQFIALFTRQSLCTLSTKTFKRLRCPKKPTLFVLETNPSKMNIGKIEL